MGKLHDALKKSSPKRGRGGSSAVAEPAAPQRPQVPADGSEGAQVYVPASLRNDVDPRLVPIADPQSFAAEQYRTLRTGLLELAKSHRVWKTFAVTSASPREGRSVTCANLACALAEQTDRKVVVVDADLRSPSQHRLLAVDCQKGLSDYLAGGAILEMALQRSRIPNLWVLPSGRTPENPAEVLQSKRLEDLLARLRRDYDYVLMDTPATLAAPDAALLAPRADGTVFVVRMERTHRNLSKKAIEALRKAHANVVGTVLTGA